MALARAVKTDHLDDPFERLPQQSDYVAAWDGANNEARWAVDAMVGLRAATLRVLRRSGAGGRAAARWLQGMNERRVNSLRNRSSFTPE